MWTGRSMFLSVFLADIAQRQAELAEDRVAHVGRNADAAGLGQRLEPRRDIDPVAKSSRSIVDDVAEIDADAQQHPPLSGNIEVALGHDLLDRDGAFDRAHGARELRDNAVACDVDDGPAVPGDERQNDRLVRFEIAHRLFFVAPHEARVASDVRGQNGRKAPFVGMEGLRPLGHGVVHATLGLGARRIVEATQPRSSGPYRGGASSRNCENYLLAALQCYVGGSNPGAIFNREGSGKFCST